MNRVGLVIVATLALSGFGAAQAQTKLDINTATKDQISALICQKVYVDARRTPNQRYCASTAQKVIAGRRYASPLELLQKHVLSIATYRAVANHVQVGAATTPIGPTTPAPTQPAAGSETLPFPKAVDHTSKQSPARDQGRRGTCIAFSTTAGLEAWDKALDLSEQHAFWQMREQGGYKNVCLSVKYDPANPKLCQDRGCYGTNLSNAVSVLQARGLVGESDWAYLSQDNTEPGTNCHEVITWASKLPSLAGKRTVKLGAVEWLASPGGWPKEKRVDDPMVLMAILAQGYSVNIAIGVAGTGWRSGEMIDVELDPTTKKPVEIRGGHGLLLVGYDYDKKAFKFKNSWSNTWGQSGYGWFTFDYLKTYVTGGYYAKGIKK
jgi:hypothetical protein